MSKATIHAAKNFDSAMAAEEMHSALEQEDDDAKIFDHILWISSRQRQEMKIAYAEKFGEDLMAAMEKRFSGDVKSAVDALLEDPIVYDCKQLRKAIKGLRVDDNALIEILCTRSPKWVRHIYDEYYNMYGIALDDDISEGTSGEYRNLMVALAKGCRSESVSVDLRQSTWEAFNSAYETDTPNDKDGIKMFSDTFSFHNFDQLRALVKGYKEWFGVELEDDIRKRFKGDLRAAYLAIVTFVVSPAKFFAEQLYKSMKGLGTDDETLVRVLVTRSEWDLAAVRNEFSMLYGKTLHQFIAGDTSGSYRDLLHLVLIGNPA